MAESPVILDLTLAEFELATSLVVLGGHFLAIHEGHPAPLDDAAFKERVAVAMRPSPASKTLMRKIVAATILIGEAAIGQLLIEGRSTGSIAKKLRNIERLQRKPPLFRRKP